MRFIERWRTLVNDQDQSQSGNERRISISVFGTTLIKIDNNRLFKLGIVLGIVLILMVIIVATLTSRKTEVKKKLHKSPDDTSTLTLLGNTGFSIFNTQTKQKVTYTRLIRNISAYEVYGQRMFRADQDDYQIVYKDYHNDNFKNNETTVNILMEEPRFRAQDMAYDHIGNNLYAIDEQTEILVVINVETKYHSILMTDLVRPHHIEIDPYEGIMFVLQYFLSIRKANLDGKSVENYFVSSSVSSMTIDRKAQRLYWMNEDGIGSADYNMKNRLSFHDIEPENVVDLAVINNDIFWLVLKPHRHNTSVIHHELLSCKIDYGICVNHSVTDFGDLGDSGFLKASHNYAHDNASVYNPCHRDNGGCQHLCLIVPDGKHSCACKLGWKLNLDEKTCDKVVEFMIYTTKGYFRGQSLDSTNNSSNEIFFPVTFERNSRQQDLTNIHFDYDMQNDKLYYTNGTDIHVVKLRNSQFNDSIIVRGDDITDVAFDWMSYNLYYLQDKHPIGYKLCVVNVRSEKLYTKTLLEVRNETSPEMQSRMLESQIFLGYYMYDHTNSLEIYPDSGSIFYLSSSNSMYASSYINVYKFNETKQLLSIRSPSLARYNRLLTLDYDDQRIYWISNNFNQTVQHADFNGNDIKNITIDDAYPVKISVLGNWLYLVTSSSILRADKLNGGQLEAVKNFSHHPARVSLKVMSEKSKQMLNGQEHPCNKNNGECEEFCFLRNSEATCECEGGKSLDVQGNCIPK